jgi:hypothetical protein
MAYREVTMIEVKEVLRQWLSGLSRKAMVRLVVDAVLNLVSLPIHGPLFRTVPLHIPVDVNLDHLVRSEETVADSLSQRIGVNGRSEVVDVRDVFRLLRSGGKTDLGRA